MGLWALVTADKRHVAICALLVALLGVTVTYRVHVAIVRGQRDTCQASLTAIDAAAKAQVEASARAGERLEREARDAKARYRRAVEGASGGGCAISGDAFNRLRAEVTR